MRKNINTAGIGELVGKSGQVGIEVTFVTKKAMRDLNRKYRQINKATTVLTFYQGELTPEKTLYLGDIVICPTQAEEGGYRIGYLIEHGINNLLSEIPAADDKRT